MRRRRLPPTRTALLWLWLSLLAGAGVALLLYWQMEPGKAGDAARTPATLPGARAAVSTRSRPAPGAPSPAAPARAIIGIHLAAIPGNPGPVLERAGALGVGW
ncbi:MAG: hypothetical protein HY784_12195, partial [Chloroflexi bacterium]|nr:hypothetical protein [Chloroflexota bacterium]